MVMSMCPLLRGSGPSGIGESDVEGGITLDGELGCPAATHPKCVAVGTCQGSCLGEVID